MNLINPNSTNLLHEDTALSRINLVILKSNGKQMNLRSYSN